MFYAEFGVTCYRPHISNYILRFAAHYQQCRNSQVVRMVSYDEVVWC